MKIREIQSKSVLSPSKVFDYVINPYVGCAHGCTYCYARFMKRFTGHMEAWGAFVDVKINAPEILRKDITRRRRGSVWISGVCDPYQPLEAKYALTRQCLDILAQNEWPAVIQTRSPLVLRDAELLKRSKHFEAGLSIPTSDDRIRKLFEPHAPPIEERIRTVESLHRQGICTYVMMAPLLPEAEPLIPRLAGKVDYVIVDRMNYHHADWVYRKHGWHTEKTDVWFEILRRRIGQACRTWGVTCRFVY